MSEPRRDRAAARQSPVRTLGKGVSRVESRADGKRKSRPKQPLSFRGAKRRGNPFSLKQQCFLHGVKETRIATASDVGHWPRNDSGVLYPAFSFTHWHSLPPGDPSVACAAAPIAGAPKGAERCPVAPVLNFCREAPPLRYLKGAPRGAEKSLKFCLTLRA